MNFTAEDNKRLIRRFVVEAINKKNYAALDDLVAENFIEDLPFPGQGPGRAGLKQALEVFHAAFPDMRFTIEEQIAEGEKVVSRFVWTGTHRGDFLGIPATGKQVKVWGVVIDVVKDGVFTQSRILMDTAGLLGQLGAAPAPR